MMPLNLQRLHALKVVVGIPSPGVWCADFGMALCNMISAFHVHSVGQFKEQVINIASSKGSILPRQRENIVTSALKAKADYLLWLDCDHTFPPRLLHQMIMDGKDVVAINCVTKHIPCSPTARKFDPNDERGEAVYTDPDSPKLEKVWRIGTGLMLVDMKVYKATGANIFDMRWREKPGAYQGEDWSMCEAIERAGFEIWVDHELSNEVGHIGQFEFTHEYVGTRVLRKSGNVVPADAQTP